MFLKRLGFLLHNASLEKDDDGAVPQVLQYGRLVDEAVIEVHLIPICPGEYVCQVLLKPPLHAIGAPSEIHLRHQPVYVPPLNVERERLLGGNYSRTFHRLHGALGYRVKEVQAFDFVPEQVEAERQF